MGLIASVALDKVRTGLAFTVLMAAASPAGPAWGQAQVSPGTSAEQASPEGMVGAVIVVAIGMVVILAALVKMFDLRSKRQSEAMLLQASISDAMLRDPMLCRLPVTATAHVPLWRGTPVTVAITGRVPSDDLRRAAVRLVEREGQRLRPDVQIESRIAVGATAQRAA